jgi:hypothetical protein
MWHIRQCVFVLGMIAAAVANLFADTCNTNGPINGLNICWRIPHQANTDNNPLWPWCSPTSGTQCGFFYTTTGSNGWNSFVTAQYGWHGFDPRNYTPQGYLDYLTGVGTRNFTGVDIDLSSTSSLHIGGAIGTQYLNPISDNGYFLSTADSTNTPGIKIDFSNPIHNGIKDFAMYWGSVDPWNTITFTDTNGATHIFSGSQIPGYNSFNQNGDNTTSILVHFSVPAGGKPWTQVAFTSCYTTSNHRVVCEPAFEFDNMEWKNAPLTCCSVTTDTSSPVPEPSALIMLAAAIICGAGWLRRRTPSGMVMP